MKLDFSAGSDLGQGRATFRLVPPPAPLEFHLPRWVLRQLILAAAYVVVMAVAFRDGSGTGLIFAIFGLLTGGYYGLPLVIARMSHRLHLNEFVKPRPRGGLIESLQRGGTIESPRRAAWGIDTSCGYLPGRAAWAQIMTVPLLMLAWAMIVAIMR